MTRFTKSTLILSVAALGLAACETGPAMDEATTPSTAAAEAGLCTDFGPQTPRDITSKVGLNLADFEMAPASTDMNLCNIHTHTNAEHKGPGFSVYAGPGPSGGYQCNATADLTAAELSPYTGERNFEGAEPGDTIEVHWVHTSCETARPGEGLGACVPATCSDPVLRVETQVFLVTNDGNGESMMDYASLGNIGPGAKAQPFALPIGTGTPVVFRGSTTGPSYDSMTCSPAQVTWSVRPQCAKVDAASVHEWAKTDSAFKETKTHGVRELVTAPELLSPIK